MAVRCAYLSVLALALCWLFSSPVQAAVSLTMRWTQIQPNASSPLPPGRKDFGFGYDSIRNRLIVFGGAGGKGTDDTWIYDIASATWREAAPTIRPPRRFSMVSAVDQGGGRDRFLIATGEGPGRVFYNDIWQFDLSTEQWSELTVSGARPSKRYGAAGGVFPLSPSKFYVTHGFQGTTRFDDTWIFDLATNSWIEVTPEEGDLPHARCLLSGAPASNGRLAIFGGCGSGGYGPCPAQDSWVLSLNDAAPSAASAMWAKADTCARPKVFSAMTIAPGHPGGATSAQAMMVYGGVSRSKVYDNGPDGEVSVLDLATGTWSLVQPGGPAVPSRRAGPNMVYVFDRTNGTLTSTDYVVMWGGASNTDMWRLSFDNTVALSLADCPSYFNIRLFHAVTMFLAWSVFLPAGVLVARFGRSWPNALWFKLHRPVQITGLLLAIGGLIAAILMVAIPLPTAHMVIGFIVMALGLLQPINAFFRPHKEPGQEPTRCRRYWEYLHKGSGYVAVTLGLIQPFQGILFYPAPTNTAIALYSTWFALLWTSVFVLTVLGQPPTSPVAAWFSKVTGRSKEPATTPAKAAVAMA